MGMPARGGKSLLIGEVWCVISLSLLSGFWRLIRGVEGHHSGFSASAASDDIWRPEPRIAFLMACTPRFLLICVMWNCTEGRGEKNKKKPTERVRVSTNQSICGFVILSMEVDFGSHYFTVISSLSVNNIVTCV